MKRKNTLFKKLYVELSDEDLLYYTYYFSIPATSKDDKIRYLVNNISSERIENAKNGIDEKLARSKDLYENLDPLILKRLLNFYRIPSIFLTPLDKLNYLYLRYLEYKIMQDIDSIKKDINLCQEFCRNLSSECLSKLYSEFSKNNSHVSNDDRINFLVNNYSFNTIKTKYEFLVEKKIMLNEMLNELNDFDDEFLEMLFEEFDISEEYKNKQEKLEFIIDNYEIKNINYKKNRLINKINEEREREKEIMFMYEDLYNNYNDTELNKLFRHFQIPKECKTKEEKINFILKTYYPRNVRNFIKWYNIKRKPSNNKKNFVNVKSSDSYKKKLIKNKKESNTHLLIKYYKSLICSTVHNWTFSLL